VLTPADRVESALVERVPVEASQASGCPFRFLGDDRQPSARLPEAFRIPS